MWSFRQCIRCIKKNTVCKITEKYIIIEESERGGMVDAGVDLYC